MKNIIISLFLFINSFIFSQNTYVVKKNISDKEQHVGEITFVKNKDTIQLIDKQILITNEKLIVVDKSSTIESFDYICRDGWYVTIYKNSSNISISNKINSWVLIKNN